MDLRQTEEYGKYMKSKGWVVEDGFFIRKLRLFRLSLLKYQRWNGQIDLKKLALIKKKYRVIYAVLEPGTNFQVSSDNFQKHGYKLSSSPYLPTKTVVIDLTKSEEKILAEMSKDTRQKIKKFSSFKVQVSMDLDLDTFRNQWKKQNKGYVPNLQSLQNLKKSFGDKCWIMTTGTAGVVILLSDDTAYYYFAWTNGEGRESGAQYQLIWEAMKKAKKIGLKKFDLEGIYDSRWPLNRWKGFTAFKKKFGGEEIEYPGSWQKWF